MPEKEQSTVTLTIEGVPSDWASMFNALVELRHDDLQHEHFGRMHECPSEPEVRIQVIMDATRWLWDQYYGEGACDEDLEGYKSFSAPPSPEDI